MAKVVGLVGSASGKVGNVVYAVSNGVQIARVYQPNVSNPKSSAQMAQRAKGNLVGRLSAIVPSSALVGLGNNRRSRRAAFLKNALKVATVTSTETNGFSAKIQPENIVFSQGSVSPLLRIVSSDRALSSTVINFARLDGVTDERAEKSKVMFIVLFADENGNYEYTNVEVVDIPAASATITIAHPTFADTTYSGIYMIPMEVVDTNKLSTSTEGIVPSASEITAILETPVASSAFSFGNSMFISWGAYAIS